ncbi:hypothetical protein CKA32_001890 [Geitlerinema sp. FC II]|nr:hypothetical protein [Geitlerinema sp. CS-897]PPT07703.1 hypothetical protein CKA32_001890 [Geitlerinema sp. FC II]
MRGRPAVSAKQFDLTGSVTGRYSHYCAVFLENRDRGSDASMS